MATTPQSPGALMRIGPRNNDSMTVATGERAVARPSLSVGSKADMTFGSDDAGFTSKSRH
jgi:hypothetical protein